MRRDPGRPANGGVTSLELVVALTIGLVVTGAALALLAAGNRWVSDGLREQDEWQRIRAAAVLLAGEWRGAGYDPTRASGSGIARLAPESIDFSADWNGDGALLPTRDNPNERLSWAVAPGSWRRGVNGGPRVTVAWPDSIRFAYRGDSGELLGERPLASEATLLEVRVRSLRDEAAGTRDVTWWVARRDP